MVQAKVRHKIHGCIVDSANQLDVAGLLLEMIQDPVRSKW